MDEIALKKGKGDYLVILVDLDTHEVIDLLESRTKEFLINYFTDKGKAFCEQAVRRPIVYFVPICGRLI